jgi:hypothetical protein
MTSGEVVSNGLEAEVQYDWAGSRSRWFGDMELRYDKWGYRLKWVGDVELHY